MSPIWLVPAAAGVAGAVALTRAARHAVRRAELLRLSLMRLGELRPPVRGLATDVRALGATLDELRRRP